MWQLFYKKTIDRTNLSIETSFLTVSDPKACPIVIHWEHDLKISAWSFRLKAIHTHKTTENFQSKAPHVFITKPLPANGRVNDDAWLNLSPSP